MQVNFEPAEYDRVLDRDVVAEETDVELLKEWLDDMRSVAEEITANLSAYKLAGVQPSHSMTTKLGYTKIAIIWLVKRLIELGDEDEETDTRKTIKNLRATLTDQSRSNAEKNQQIKRLKARIVELEAMLRKKGN